ncbi:MAG: mandelate racemase, partial [Ramlibacter sp.]|nr:mandelate racemase [Ramlibacter sp.]
MAEAPVLSIRAIELYERPVKLRMPFRFGVVTLTESPQAFARVQVSLPGGGTAWGAAAELMAPKWFDKNLALTNEDNFDQLRDVLRMARDAYLSDAS